MASSSDPCVLIVEDEIAQLELVAYNFEKEGFRVVCASDGEEGLLAAEEEEPDLIVLDWMLPKVSGIEVCRQLKRQNQTKQIPVLMLTARGEEADRVRGLDTGADDYVVKPYSVNELMARARAMLRRSRPASIGETLSYRDITLDAEQHKVRRAGQSIKLGPTEFRLLSVLIERPGRVWTREQLLNRIWGNDADVDFRTVDVHVGRLRKALQIDDAVDPVRTVRGTGYSLDYDG